MMSDERIAAEQAVRNLERQLNDAARDVPLVDVVVIVRGLRQQLVNAEAKADALNPVLQPGWGKK